MKLNALFFANRLFSPVTCTVSMCWKNTIFIVEQIEDQVVHVILELSSPDSLDEYRTEAVAVSIQAL